MLRHHNIWVQYRNCGEVHTIPTIPATLAGPSKRHPTALLVTGLHEPIYAGKMCEIEGVVGRVYTRKGEGNGFFFPTDADRLAMMRATMGEA